MIGGSTKQGKRKWERNGEEEMERMQDREEGKVNQTVKGEEDLVKEMGRKEKPIKMLGVDFSLRQVGEMRGRRRVRGKRRMGVGRKEDEESNMVKQMNVLAAFMDSCRNSQPKKPT